MLARSALVLALCSHLASAALLRRHGSSSDGDECGGHASAWQCESHRPKDAVCVWQPTADGQGSCVKHVAEGACSKLEDEEDCHASRGCFWLFGECSGCGYRKRQCPSHRCAKLDPDLESNISSPWSGPTKFPLCFSAFPASCRSSRLQASKEACEALSLGKDLVSGKPLPACQWNDADKMKCQPRSSMPELTPGATEETALQRCTTLHPTLCRAAAGLCRVPKKTFTRTCLAVAAPLTDPQVAIAQCPILPPEECKHRGRQLCAEDAGTGVCFAKQTIFTEQQALLECHKVSADSSGRCNLEPFCTTQRIPNPASQHRNAGYFRCRAKHEAVSSVEAAVDAETGCHSLHISDCYGADRFCAWKAGMCGVRNLATNKMKECSELIDADCAADKACQLAAVARNGDKHKDSCLPWDAA